jgi:hypothetical protein
MRDDKAPRPLDQTPTPYNELSAAVLRPCDKINIMSRVYSLGAPGDQLMPSSPELTVELNSSKHQSSSATRMLRLSHLEVEGRHAASPYVT